MMLSTGWYHIASCVCNAVIAYRKTIMHGIGGIGSIYRQANSIIRIYSSGVPLRMVID